MGYKSNIIPTTGQITVSHSHKLGVADYDLDDLYSPDTNFWKSTVLDLVSPKYSPNATYIFDKSRYQNHGTITGATWVRLSSGLPVLSFGTTADYIQLPDEASIHPVTGTILMWVNRNVTTGDQYLYSRADEWALYLTANKLQAYYDSLLVAELASFFVAGTFAFVAFTFTQGGTGYLYRNGVEVASGNCSATAPTGGTHRIGNLSINTNYPLNGLCGGFRMYNRALSAVEVASDYQRERHLFGR